MVTLHHPLLAVAVLAVGELAVAARTAPTTAPAGTGRGAAPELVWEATASYVGDDAAPVFRLRAGAFEPWAKVDLAQTGGPNGLLAERDRLLLGSWVVRGAGGQDRFGILSTVAYADGSVRPLGAHRIGNIDGIEPDGRGGYTVTDWETGDLLQVSAGSAPTRIMTVRRGAADHHYVAAQRLLVIPLVLDNAVRAYRWASAK